MVERTSSTGLDEFEGTARSVVLEAKHEKNGKTFPAQYHIEIEPANKDLIRKDSKTGVFHEWIRLPNTATETSVPDGSVIDNYLKAVERVVKEAKKADTVEEELRMLLGKQILYKREVLGKAFGNNEASVHWIPVSLAR